MPFLAKNNYWIAISIVSFILKKTYDFVNLYICCSDFFCLKGPLQEIKKRWLVISLQVLYNREWKNIGKKLRKKVKSKNCIK